MNLENLEINKEYKSYREVCVILDEPIKSGKSKQLQLKEWGRYFKWETKGYKFIVKLKYDTPKPKVDNRGKSEGSRGNNIGGEYTKYVQPLLKNYLSNCKDDVIYTTNTQLGKYLGFITDNFESALTNKTLTLKILKEQLGINNYYSYWDMLDKSKESYKGLIQYNLRKLQNENYIEFEYNYIFISLKIEDDAWGYTIPDAKEIKKIKLIENEILAELELSTKSDLAFCSERKVKEFYKKFENKIIKEFDVMGIFQGYEIKILQDIELENITGYQSNINNKFQEKIYNNLSKLEDKALDKMHNFKELTKKEEARVSDDYLNQCKVVIKELLSCNNTIHLNKLIDKKLKEIEKTKAKVKKIKERDMKEKKKFKTPLGDYSVNNLLVTL